MDGVSATFEILPWELDILHLFQQEFGLRFELVEVVGVQMHFFLQGELVNELELFLIETVGCD